MRYPEERAEVARAGVEMLERGFTEATSGNCSMRVPDGALITPSSIPYHDITPEDIVLLDLQGTVLEGTRVQSVEHQVHLELYRRRANVGAVVHSHPIVATAFAAARRPLPAFIEEFGVFVGDEVRVAEFGISGTPEVAVALADAMGDNNAAFLANHGLVCVGKDLQTALTLTSRVERACQTFIWTQLLGGPAEIPQHAQDLYRQVFDYMQKQ